jgi:uncharacterized membrane protein YdbT with pleckstrin-like domain
MNTIYELRPSPMYALVKILPLLCLTLILLPIAYEIYPYLIFLALILAILTVYRYLKLYSVRYLISPEVLRVRTGIFFRQTESMELFRIKDYVITQPFWMQMAGLMNLRLFTTDDTNHLLTLTGIPFSNLTDNLRELVQQARLKNKIIEIS